MSWYKQHTSNVFFRFSVFLFSRSNRNYGLEQATNNVFLSFGIREIVWTEQAEFRPVIIIRMKAATHEYHENVSAFPSQVSTCQQGKAVLI